MEGTYFRDTSESDSSGLIVTNVTEQFIRVTENRNGWCAPFLMPHDEFEEYTSKNTEKVGKLPNQKFEKVVRLKCPQL